MTDDDKREQTSQDTDDSGGDAVTAFEEYAGDNKCPECGEPIIDVRANCPNCGYKYEESDYSDKDAGSEYVSGSAVDDEGNENPDDVSGTGEEDEPAADSGSDE